MSALLPGDLAELQHHWGSAYDIAVAGGECKDGEGTLTDRTPAGLRRKILADYYICPVPRDLS